MMYKLCILIILIIILIILIIIYINIYIVNHIEIEPLTNNKSAIIYNGLNWHYEMFGFILDYCNNHNINVIVVNKTNDIESSSWFEMYKQKYNFKLLSTLPTNLYNYNFIILLTESDNTFPNKLIHNKSINNKLIAVKHTLSNMNPLIKHKIYMTNYKKNKESYLLPIFNYISLKDKQHIIIRNKPIIVVLGQSCFNLDSIPEIILNYNDFKIIAINRTFISTNISYIEYHQNVKAVNLFSILSKATYVLWINNKTRDSNIIQNNNMMSGSFPISFTTGCKLILHSNMKSVNSYLKSIIYYNNKIKLKKYPNIKSVFSDRRTLVKIRNKTLNFIINQI